MSLCLTCSRSLTSPLGGPEDTPSHDIRGTVKGSSTFERNVLCLTLKGGGKAVLWRAEMNWGTE